MTDLSCNHFPSPWWQNTDMPSVSNTPTLSSHTQIAVTGRKTKASELLAIAVFCTLNRPITPAAEGYASCLSGGTRMIFHSKEG